MRNLLVGNLHKVLHLLECPLSFHQIDFSRDEFLRKFDEQFVDAKKKGEKKQKLRGS